MIPEMLSTQSTEMEKPKEKTQVKACIDFRTWKSIVTYLQETHKLSLGDFYLDTRAGASINPSKDGGDFIKFINIDHETCGRYSAEEDDSALTHEKNMQEQGRLLLTENPNIKYQSHLLPVNDHRHECEAVAIIYGKPEIVRAAFKEIANLGLANNCDIIARAEGLSVNDKAIWNKSENIREKGDLPIALHLHHPKKILIFDESEENAKMLIEKAKEIAGNIQIETKVLQKVA